MARIFLALALFVFALLVANLVIGYAGGDYCGAARKLVEAKREIDTLAKAPHSDPWRLAKAQDAMAAAADEFAPLKRWTAMHILLGIAAALVTVLVNSITVTYFIGTSRWCKEVVTTYRLDDELANRSTRLKRRTFPWALLSMLLIIGQVALGAASDPGANFAGAESCVPAHQIMAWIVVIGIGWSLFVQVSNIGANYEIIEEILARVTEIRRKKGLDAEPTETAATN